MVLSDDAFPIAAVIALSGLLLKLRDLRRDPGSTGLRAICIVLASLAAAVLVDWEPAYLALDTATGVPNVARLVQHAFSLTGAAAIQVLFLHLDDPQTAPRRARTRWVILGGVLAVMAVMFWRGDFAIESPHGFVDQYADDPNIVPYLLFFLSYQALAMADIFRASTRYARHAPRALLRLGIRLLAIGSVIGLTYVVHKAGFVIAHRLDVRMPWGESAGSRLLTLAGIAFVTTGLVLPSLGTAAGKVRRWPRQRRLYRQLRPLWSVVTEAVPEVVLYRQPCLLVFRGASHALYRRVIEIHDGILQLRPYADPDDLAAARRSAGSAGLSAAETMAALKVAALASGIRRKAAGLPMLGAVEFFDDDSDACAADPADPAAAAERLVQVIRAHPYCRSSSNTARTAGRRSPSDPTTGAVAGDDRSPVPPVTVDPTIAPTRRR